MPRRRNSEGGATPIRRVRTGCLTCRERKIKCDEAKPRCRNCLRRGVACITGVQLKWEQEFASRGLAFGRQGRQCPRRSSLPGHNRPHSQHSPSLPCPLLPLPRVRAHHFINTLHWELTDGEAGIEGDEGEGNGDDDSNGQGESAPIVLVRSPSPYPTLAQVDTSLLDYYLLHLCPLTTLSRQQPSPFAALVAPVFAAPGHGDLLRAAMALAARHRSNMATNGNTQWTKMALGLREGVLSSLRRRLACLAGDGGSSGSGGGGLLGNATPLPREDSLSTFGVTAVSPPYWDSQVLVIMMFLCLYEIVDNCDHRWVIHLRASQDIIRLSREVLPTIAAAPGRGGGRAGGGGWGGGRLSPAASQAGPLAALTAFTERFFAFQDVVSRAACENPPLFGHEYWDKEATAAAVAGKPKEGKGLRLVVAMDCWMGCRTELVRILCRITEISRLKARRAVTAEVFQAAARALEKKLEDLEWEEAGCDGSATADDNALLQSAELKRRAVLLYHYCVLYDAMPATPRVAELVADILQGAAALAAAGRTAGLSFAVFVAAVELDPLCDEMLSGGSSPKGSLSLSLSPSPSPPSSTSTGRSLSGRRLVLGTLEIMSRTSLSNIARTRSVISKVWRMRDLSLDGDGAARQLPPDVNDWTHFVAPYSSNISLV